MGDRRPSCLPSQMARILHGRKNARYSASLAQNSLAASELEMLLLQWLWRTSASFFFLSPFLRSAGLGMGGGLGILLPAFASLPPAHMATRIDFLVSFLAIQTQ